MKKTTKEEITASPIENTVAVKIKIEKVEPFGNEEMHKLVAKINEIIDHV